MLELLYSFLSNQDSLFILIFLINKTPAQAFTPPADEKKMAQSGYLCTTPSTAQAGADAGISWS